MQKVGIGAMVVAAVLTCGTSAFARSMTVTGTLVDEGCGLKDAVAKKAMKSDCETECAKRGEPVALLTADGRVYRVGGGLAANKNAKLVAYIGHSVRITGDVTVVGDKSVIAADALSIAK